MDPNDTTPTAGDTAAAPGTDGQPPAPGPVPYDRFKEVIENQRALKDELTAERNAREQERQRWEALLAARATPAAPPPPPEDEDLDPGEKALRELQRLRQDLTRTDEQRRAQDAQAQEAVTLREIQRAVKGRTFDDRDDATERLAERYIAARRFGRPFDAEAEADALVAKQAKAREGWAGAEKRRQVEEKKQAAERTQSALVGGNGGAPPTNPTPLPEAPKYGTPGYKEKVRDGVRAIFRQYQGT